MTEITKEAAIDRLSQLRVEIRTGSDAGWYAKESKDGDYVAFEDALAILDAALSTLPIAGEGKVKAGKRWCVFENIFAGEWGIEEDDADGEVILPPRRIVREYLDDIVARFNAALSSAQPTRMDSIKAKSPSSDRVASEEVFSQLILIKQLAKDTTERNWADKSLYIAQAAERALAEGSGQ